MDSSIRTFLTPINMLLLVIVLYIVFFACNLPNNIYVIVNHWFVKLVVLVCIIFSYQYSIPLTILLAIAFLVTLNCNKKTIEPVVDTYIKTSPNMFNSIPSGSTTDEIPECSLDLINDVNDVKSNKCSDFYPQYEHIKTINKETITDDISVNGFDGGASYSQL